MLVYFGFPKHDAERAVRIGLEFAAEPRGRWLAPTGARYKVDGTARPGTPMTVFVERPTTLHAICLATTLSDPLADNMGKRRTPWFWNTAILARVAWLLLVVVFAAYASRTLLFTASVSQALAHWGWP